LIPEIKNPVSYLYSILIPEIKNPISISLLRNDSQDNQKVTFAITSTVSLLYSKNVLW
jgi:hypothetical protein